MNRYSNIIENNIRYVFFLVLYVAITSIAHSQIVTNSSAKRKEKSGCILESDSLSPIVGATILIWPMHLDSRDSIKTISDANGNFQYISQSIEERIIVRYFGKEVLDTLVNAQNKSSLRFYINPAISLNEVTIVGQRKFISRSFSEDIVRVKKTEIFKLENFTDILSLIPGVILSEENCSYFNYPIVGMRFGKKGALKPINKQSLRGLQSIYAENIEKIIFKRISSGQGVQYEIIIDVDTTIDYSLTPSFKTYMGKKTNVETSIFSQFNKNRLNNLFLLTGDCLRQKRMEETTYQTAIGSPFVNTQDEERGRAFRFEYNGLITLSEKISTGASVCFAENRTKKERLSKEKNGLLNFTYDPIIFSDQTYSLFSDIEINKHHIHWEASYNRSNKDIEVYQQRDKIQTLSSIDLSPNTSLDYSYSNSPKTFQIDAKFAYSSLHSSSKDIILNKNFTLDEYTLSQSLSFAGKIKKLTGFIGLQFEYNKNDYRQTTNLLPKASIAFEDKNLQWGVDYSKMIERPLAWMLSENNTIETSSLISTGNSELLATTKHQIGVNLSYNNFYMQISKKWISDIPDYIPVGYNGSILVKKWMNIGKQDLWVLHSSYSVRFNRVYINPNINIEFGRFFDAVQWIKNSFATITIPFLYHYNRHKIQIDASFIPKSHFYNTTTDAMIVLNARYTIGLLKDQLTLKIFANDIFNSLSSEKNKFQAKDFISRTSLHKDKRQIGISISYNFSQGKMKFFEGVRNNINRNK